MDFVISQLVSVSACLTGLLSQRYESSGAGSNSNSKQVFLGSFDAAKSHRRGSQALRASPE